jgi:transcriptional regulator with XRE-family HTH domain
MTASTAAVLVGPHVGVNQQASAPTRLRGVGFADAAHPLDSYRVRHSEGDGWDREGFRDYILSAAARQGMRLPAEIARACDVTASQLSKWLRGIEQPSVASLKRIAGGLNVPRRDLYALAGRFSEEDLELTGTPELPTLANALAREIDAMLSEDSPLTEERRESLRTVVDAVLVSYRGDMRRRRTA